MTLTVIVLAAIISAPILINMRRLKSIRFGSIQADFYESRKEGK